MATFPSATTADGIWTLKKQKRAKQGGDWPTVSSLAPTLAEYANGTVTNHGTGLGGGYGTCFNSNGSKFYVSGYTAQIKQYSLSTAYDISTASLVYTYDGDGLGCGSSLSFNPDGTVFFFGDYGTEIIRAKNLSSPYNLSSITGTDADLSNNTNGGWWFNGNGTKVYCTDRNYIMYSFNLSTAYDLSSAGTRSAGIDLSSLVSDGGMYGGRFYSDGLVLYVGTRSANDIYRFVLSTPYDETSIYAATTQNFPHAVYSIDFSPDFSLLVTGAGSGTAGTVASYEI